MTADDETHSSAPVVVPRWEWRTVGDLEGADQALAFLRETEPAESDETYVLSMHGDASVKVRDGLLDVKVLQQVNGAGLQLWVPTVKAPFPLDDDTVATVRDALGAPQVTSRPSASNLEELVEGLIGSRDDLRAVEVHKSRRRAVLDGCMVELTELTVEGTTTSTAVAEAPDPALVSDTVRRLGLAGRTNVPVARGLKTALGWGPTRYAVVDVGTNSVKFALGDRVDGVPQSRLDTAVVTRLGEGLAQAGELTPDAMSRTVEAIGGLVDDARRDGPLDVVAVGTAGLRQAPNRDAFVDAVHRRCGVTVEVISGQEEARLAYVAAVSSLPLVDDQRLLVFDSGGGSSQFTFGTLSHIDEQFSLDVGAVRFTERFGLADAVPGATVDDALAAIAADLETLAGRPAPDQVVAIGGTSTNLAAVSHGLGTYDPDVVHGTVVTLAEVDRQIEAYRRLTAEERRAIPGLQPARAEVILAGACIVRTIITSTGQAAVTVSDRGLRHGVVTERFGGAGRA